MNENVRVICLEIVDDLIERPSAYYFRDPIDPELDELPDYLSIITNPMDLSLIRERLEEGYYRSIEQWRADFDLMWENCTKYFGADSLENATCDELKSRFKKLCRRLDVLTEAGWMNVAVKTMKKLEIQMSKAHIKSDNFLGAHSSVQEGQRRICSNLLRATKKLTSKDDALKILQIMEITGVPVDYRQETTTYELTQLPPATLAALQLYSKERFRQFDEPYPG